MGSTRGMMFVASDREIWGGDQRQICGEVCWFYREISLTLWISQSLEQGITSVRRIGQRYCRDETSPAVVMLAALSRVSVSE